MKYTPPRFIEILLWLALLLALAGSLKHLAAIFAAVDGHWLMGWLQAIAIDAGVFALAFSIRVHKAQGRTARPIWVGLALFSAISIYGNLAYGLLATTGQLPTWMIVTKPYLLAASLPVLVLFLSELLSDNRLAGRTQSEQSEQKANDPATPEQTTHDQGEQTANDPTQAERELAPRANEANDQGEQANSYQSTIFALLDRQPDLGPTEIAAQTGASKSTAAKWHAAWHKLHFHRNGAHK